MTARSLNQCALFRLRRTVCWSCALLLTVSGCAAFRPATNPSDSHKTPPAGPDVSVTKGGVPKVSPPTFADFRSPNIKAGIPERIKMTPRSEPPKFAVIPASMQVPEAPLPSGDEGPSSPARVRIPVQDRSQQENIQLSHDNDRISLNAHDAPINVVLNLIAEQHGLNVVAGEDVDQKITIKIRDVQLTDALDAILLANGYTWTQHKNILIVSSVSSENRGSPMRQGRELQVLTLNYVSASEVDKVVKGLLSPVGQSFINQTVATDQRRTQEQLVVEDLPAYLQRIEQYVSRVDQPPRQVLVEARVLQVQLKENCRSGIDFRELIRIAHSDVTISMAGMTTGTVPAGLLRIDGTQLDSLIELLQSTTDSKTLAAPKVAVLNGQEARIQVGGQIGYLLTTTTQTSTLQSVNFLDVGVILRVTPIITDDHQVLMQVRPQVSTGRINPVTQLPESETTEVETRIMLADGEALVIGGLIKETDSDSQNKIPWLGNLWLIGRLFQHRDATKERNEIIITLLPRIISDAPGLRAVEPHAVEQAATPLLIGPLCPLDRRIWEPELPDASHKHHYPLWFPGEWNDGSVPGPAYEMIPPPAPEAVQQMQPPPVVTSDLQPANFLQPVTSVPRILYRLPEPN